MLSLFVGSKAIPPATVLNALCRFDPTNNDHLFVREDRLPRTLLGLLVGAGLGLAGTVMQAVARNPLADPGVELLDADLTVVFPIGSDAAVLRADRVLNQIPSAPAGRLVILDDPDLINAFSSGSTLGTVYVVENAVPLFTEALG